MGSTSDWETMQHAAQTLTDLGVPFEKLVVSAHRTPDLMFEYARSAEKRGLKTIIAGAGGAAHLPGMVAALTPLPVLGVPVESRVLKGQVSLLSIVQMPGGIPVATFALGSVLLSGSEMVWFPVASVVMANPAMVGRPRAALRARLAAFAPVRSGSVAIGSRSSTPRVQDSTS